jgi:hypothetical protein
VREIEGVEITNSDGRWIVARLRDVGRADDATAAVSIEHGLDFGYAIDWLTPAEKDAVMMVLATSSAVASTPARQPGPRSLRPPMKVGVSCLPLGARPCSIEGSGLTAALRPRHEFLTS